MLRASNVTLITVNWDSLPALKLLLKSYVKHHYAGVPLKVKVFDNGSVDGSVEWLLANRIAHTAHHRNCGHMEGVNSLLEGIDTPVLLCDSDVRFDRNIFDQITEDALVYGTVLPEISCNSLRWLPRIEAARVLFRWDILRSQIRCFDVPQTYEEYCQIKASADSGSYFLQELERLGIPIKPFPKGTYHYQLSSYDSSGAVPDRQKILNTKILSEAALHDDVDLNGKIEV